MAARKNTARTRTSGRAGTSKRSRKTSKRPASGKTRGATKAARPGPKASAKRTAPRGAKTQKTAKKTQKTAKSPKSAKRKTAKKTATRRPTRKSTARSAASTRRPAKTAKKTAKTTGGTAAGRSRRKSTGRPSARTGASARTAKSAARAGTPSTRETRKTGSPAGRSRPAAPRPALDRSRRQLPDAERFSPASDDRVTAAARTGREELRERLTNHTATGPDLTGGDVDASWEDAYSVGDEAPGGDNPTPDQDRVDDIGKSLGVTYQPGEELESTEKIIERDRHRWELDPASSDDWPHNQD